jgi:peptide/nickel transport system substrate-binding protein
VKLNKSPAFIVQQFGLTGDNVGEKAKAADPGHLRLHGRQGLCADLVLNCLTATVGAVVDSKLVKEHVAAVTPSAEYKFDNDFGNGWLKTNYAGSGPYKTREWRANEAVVLERNDNYYGEKGKLARVIYRHVKSATQRLMLEKGDVDVARNLEPGDIDAVSKNADLTITSTPKSTVYFVSLNQKNESWPSRKCASVQISVRLRCAWRHAAEEHRRDAPELPKGILGAVDDKPYKFDIAKAKELLAKAGLGDGFSVTMDALGAAGDRRCGICRLMRAGGIKIEIIPGDFKQVLTKFRARRTSFISASGASTIGIRIPTRKPSASIRTMLTIR